MKKITIAAIAALLSLNFSYSQDLITIKSGEDMQAQILEVGQSEVKYKKFDNLNGPIFTILKSDILIIRYENGTKDIFSNKTKNEKLATEILSNENQFLKGQMDAAKFYKGYSGAGTGTLISSLISPIVGLIPAIATSSSKPNDDNLGYPNADFMNNADYYNGYTQKAKKIKQGRVWTNWGIGFGVNLAAILVLTQASN